MLELPKGQVVAGLSGVNLEFDELDFGGGLTLRKTYAHLMAPFMMAFKPAPPGKPHPAPWKAARGGIGFDITAELVIPEEYEPTRWGDRTNLVRWIIALTRIWATPNATVPVLSNVSFSVAAEAPDDQVCLIPHEVLPRGFVMNTPGRASLSADHFRWVVEHWEAGAVLLNENTEFHLAVEAHDQHGTRDT